jgi:hypothetical protein
MTPALIEVLSGVLGAAGEADAASRVGSGRITGGWEYVWAAYGITWAVVACYAFSLWVRRPGAKPKELS